MSLIFIEPMVINQFNTKAAMFQKNEIITGDGLFKQGKFNEAINYYNQMLTIDIYCIEAWYGKGLALHCQGKLEDAIFCYNQLLALDAKDKEAWNNIANALSTLGKFEEAIYCCEQALLIDNQLKEAWYNKANVLHQQNKLKNALICYEQVLLLENYHSKSLLGKLSILIEQTCFDEALTYCNQIIMLIPRHATVWRYKSEIFFYMNQTPEAKRCINTALALQPNDADSLIIKAYLYLKTRQVGKAAILFNQVIIEKRGCIAFAIQGQGLLAYYNRHPEQGKKLFLQAETQVLELIQLKRYYKLLLIARAVVFIEWGILQTAKTLFQQATLCNSSWVIEQLKELEIKINQPVIKDYFLEIEMQEKRFLKMSMQT